LSGSETKDPALPGDAPISVGVRTIRPTSGTNRMVTMLSELRFLGIRSAKL
jgi:hypothetical protein